MYEVGPTYRDSGAANRPVKNAKRKDVVLEFAKISEPSPVFLTFPGVDWLTEKEVIREREERDKEPCRFVGFEYSKSLFHQSLQNMPQGSATLYGKRRANNGIHSLYNSDFKDFNYTGEITGSWLDFVGPLTSIRMEVIKRVWEQTTSIMVITSMFGRWRGQFNNDLKNIGTENKLNGLILKELGYPHHADGEAYGAGGRAGEARMHQIKLYK